MGQSRVKESVVGERLLIVETARRKGVSAASREFKCSRTTVYALQARYEQGGLEGLVNQPRGCSIPIREEIQEAIVALKLARLERSTTKIQQLLEDIHGWPVSRQTVWRVLSARGLARLVEPEPLQRFERPRPNQLWQLDLIEDERTAIGTVHLASLLDDASRYCVGGQWIRSKAQPAVLGVIAATMASQGLPDAILSDRASIFYGPASSQQGLTVYQLALDRLAVKAVFAKPYKARTKGKVEKFQQFVERSFLGEVRNSVQSLEELNQRWQEWRRWYNEQHCHSSLAGGAPARHYRKSTRPAPPELERLFAVEQPRRVNRDATVTVGGKSYQVPPEYMGRHVWVAMLGNQLRVTYGEKTIASFTR